MKRLGPDLKMPKLKGGEMKVPPFLSDLYYDLRDRRLLPVVALVVVAIFATPFLLGGAGEPEPEPVPEVATDGAAPAAKRTLTVVKAAPGLRNYKKRLKRLKPSDPFHQRFVGPRLEGAKLNEETTTTTTTTTESGSSDQTPTSTTYEYEPSVTTSPPSGGSTGGGGGSEDADGDGIPDSSTLYTYVLDLEITRIETKPNGARREIGPKLRNDLKAPTALPGEKAPVVTYLGLGAKEPRAPMFLISPDVTAVYGEAECVAGTDTCQLIALQPKFPVTFVYGANQVRYKINVLDIRGVPVDPPE